MPTAPERQVSSLVTDEDWSRRVELADLLRASRARLARTSLPGARHRGLRQEDVASLAGLSLRRYAAFERGEFVASPGMIDQIAAALQMPDAERSALHVLAAEQDPPRPVGCPAEGTPVRPSRALRELVSHLDPYPAALTDETWTVLHHNDALDAWSGGWFTATNPAHRHLVAYLFSDSAAAFLPDVRAIRRARMAMLRYQYTRNLSPRFRGIIDRLTAGSPDAADLWARHEVAFAPHEYSVRLRTECGTVDTHVVFTPLSPRLWSFTMVLPPGVRPA
jgi:transcriptional regulator with XRE-family HTH domain